GSALRGAAAVTQDEEADAAQDAARQDPPLQGDALADVLGEIGHQDPDGPASRSWARHFVCLDFLHDSTSSVVVGAPRIRRTPRGVRLGGADPNRSTDAYAPSRLESEFSSTRRTKGSVMGGSLP